MRAQYLINNVELKLFLDPSRLGAAEYLRGDLRKKKWLIPSIIVSILERETREKKKHILHGKAELIAAAETIALMEPWKAVGTFAGLLRPRGMLAAWFYGRLIFEDETVEDTVLRKKFDDRVKWP